MTEPTVEAPAATGSPKPRSLKLAAVLVLFIGGIVGLVAWSQIWVEFRVTGTSGMHTASGNAAAPALNALSIAALALGLAMTIAGRVFRFVLGPLAVLLGVCMAWQTLLATSDPKRAAASTATNLTGVAGAKVSRDIVTQASITGWAWLGLVAAIIVIAGGIIPLVAGRRWANGGRKYERPSVRTEQIVDAENPVDTWDALTRGDDPTGEAASDSRPAADAHGAERHETAPDGP